MKRKQQNQQQNKRLQYKLTMRIKSSGLEFPSARDKPMQKNLGPHASLTYGEKIS